MTSAPTSLSQGFGSFLQRITRSADMVLGMLIVPLPEWLLDLLLVVDIGGSALILLSAFYTVEPLQFSIFPSLLLIMTLFRLALDVAATKLILGTGHAGEVIAAFGKFVVGG